MNWETVIGLEIHARLATESKLFSGTATRFGAEPNRQVSAVDLGLPGALPVVNSRAVEMAVAFGLAVHAEIAGRSVFARKNYFYPDLPKGYQISQFELPIVGPGRVTIAVNGDEQRTIGITRAHLEEDAGKSFHERIADRTAIDLNRAGTPLLEIVSDPDLRSAEEAVAYMRKIHAIVCYLKICDGNLQEGSFRCDANVSVRPSGHAKLGIRTEIKNLNSFRFIEAAINYEVTRQIAVLESGGAIVQETRLYDPGRYETRPMRGKEEANDYRYFPDPDLLPVAVSDEMIADIQATLPELPDSRDQRFMRDYGLSAYDSGVLTASRDQADYFEEAVMASGGEAKLCANWVIGELAAALNRHGLTIAESPVSASHLGGMIKRIADHTISGKIAKQVFEAMLQGEGDADSIIKVRGLRQVTDSEAIAEFVDAVIATHPKQVAQYRASCADKRGKLIGFFVGQVMKRSGGKANPKQVNQLLQERLGSG